MASAPEAIGRLVILLATFLINLTGSALCPGCCWPLSTLIGYIRELFDWPLTLAFTIYSMLLGTSGLLSHPMLGKSRPRDVTRTKGEELRTDVTLDHRRCVWIFAVHAALLALGSE